MYDSVSSHSLQPMDHQPLSFWASNLTRLTYELTTNLSKNMLTLLSVHFDDFIKIHMGLRHRVCDARPCMASWPRGVMGGGGTINCSLH